MRSEDRQKSDSDAPVPSAGAPPRTNVAGIVIIALIVVAVVGATIALAPHVTLARLEGWVQAAGPWGPLLLLGVQAAQILAAPIPGFFVPVLAGLLYGPVVGPLVTVAGTGLGSAAAYWIGRRGGRPLAARLVGTGPLEKARGLIGGKRWLALIPLFLLPFTPADALCFVAGIVGMEWKRFCIAVGFGRLPKDALVAMGAAFGWSALGF